MRHWLLMFAAKWFVISVVGYVVYWLFIRHPFDQNGHGRYRSSLYDYKDDDE